MNARERRLATWRNQFPTLESLENRARRRIPYFTFDYLEGGTGNEMSRHRNYAALRAVEIVPRYCTDISTIDLSTELFGRRYAAPLVIAPVGMDGGIWPGATRHLAQTAQELGLAHMMSTMAAAPIEEVARQAPDAFWFQLYSAPADDHRVTFDLMRRADAAGARVLAVTLDIPLPARRVRDMRNGAAVPFRITPKVLLGMLMRPRWLAALAREGVPRYANLAAYCREGATRREIEGFLRNCRAGSGITWDLIARIRDRWPRAMVLKGILHPADAEKARSLGLDGVIISNHGGRQFDPSPATIDLVPAIRAAVGRDMTVLMDSGIMSGTDILKTLAVGADAVLAGRGFMLGLAALGPDGPRHVATALMDELRIALGQTGARTIAGAASLAVRHRGCWKPEDFRAPAQAGSAVAMQPSL